MVAGFLMASYGLVMYLKIRKSRLRPPGHHTLVEVTSATLQFLEDYHFIDDSGRTVPTKQTMLGRLGDFSQTTAQSFTLHLQAKSARSLPGKETCLRPRGPWQHATVRSTPARARALPLSVPGFPLRVWDWGFSSILASAPCRSSMRCSWYRGHL